MKRESIWSISNREKFAILSIALFGIGLFLRYWGPYELTISFAVVEDVFTIIMFSVAGSFFVLQGVDLMLGIYEAVKKKNLEKGREEGQQERDKKFLEWYNNEKGKGPDGFKSPPGFLKNSS